MRDKIENARVKSINIGTSFHDGRGFATINFEGDSWGQGADFRVDKETIDGLILACDAEDLFGCIGKFCRVKRDDGTFISEIMHIIRADSIKIRG